MTIRRATLADAAALADVQSRTWMAAYAEYVDPQRILDAIEGREQRWREALPGAPATIVAEAGGRLGGFASWGPSRDGDAAPDTGELFAIYVAPEAQGAGVGGHLQTAALEVLRADGFADATLWVFEENARARDFYERTGWVFDRADLRPPRWDWAPSVRYRRPLAAVAAAGRGPSA